MNAKLWKTASIAAGISALTAVFLLIIAILLSLRLDDPAANIGLWGCLCTIIGGAVGGWLSAKLYAERSFIPPFICGILYVSILTVLTLPFSDGFGLGRFLLNAGLPLASSTVVGTLLGMRGTSRFGNTRKAAKHAGRIYKGKR
ncbi:MAG: DUF3792 family protein [Ruminococcaceae bacterium]|nr:DUF3792 family protein [Oscillospiraceae bacterium]